MHSYLQRVQQAIDDAISGMNPQQLTWHREGKWSAAAILEHLSLTYSGTAKGLQRCLQSGRPTITPPSGRQRVAAFVVTGLRYMPPGRKAPSRAVPKGKAPEAVVEEVRRSLAAADDAISRCEAQFGARAKIADHPIIGPLTAQQWRTFHWVHARHHMKQIARIRAEIGAEEKIMAARRG